MSNPEFVITLSEEHLIMLLRGGTINLTGGARRTRIEAKCPVKILKKSHYAALRRHSREPDILDVIFEEIES